MTATAYAKSADTISLQDTTSSTAAVINETPPTMTDYSWTGMLPMVAVLLIFYFLVIRPQDQKRKQQQQTIEQAKAGQNVLLSSGIYGKITRVVNENQILVSIAEGLEIKCHRNAIGELIEEKLELPSSADKATKKDPKKSPKKAKTK